jgi:hypothetical protein
MDTYDEADWTEMDIEDLRAAIEGGASFQEVAPVVLRRLRASARTEAQIAIMSMLLIAALPLIWNLLGQ